MFGFETLHQKTNQMHLFPSKNTFQIFCKGVCKSCNSNSAVKLSANAYPTACILCNISVYTLSAALTSAPVADLMVWVLFFTFTLELSMFPSCYGFYFLTSTTTEKPQQTLWMSAHTHKFLLWQTHKQSFVYRLSQRGTSGFSAFVPNTLCTNSEERTGVWELQASVSQPKGR